MPISAATRQRTTILWSLSALTLTACAGVFYFLLAQRLAPDVTFTSLSGERITTQSLRGRVVLVNFWATSCTTCIREMPKMVATYNKFKGQGMELVAVAMSYDPANYVIDYAQSRQLPFKVVFDGGGKIAQAFGDVQLTPTTFVIGKDGKIIQRYEGEPSFSELHALIETALRLH